MTKTIALAFVALALGVNASAAFAASGGTHLMWVNSYKSTPYAVWHDDATCPNRPAR